MQSHILSQPTKRELLEALRKRYLQATKPDKSKILDEFVAVADCHRKHAIRLLTEVEPVPPKPATPGRRIYADSVREAIIVLWEAADRICGKRLKAVLPSLVAALERQKHLTLDPKVRELVLAVSPATIDRLLASVHRVTSRRKRRKTTTKPGQQIPIRTFADWKEPEPGFLEVDFVAHGGTSMQGTFLWSLVATDVCSGWTEMLPLLAREQSFVVEGLEILGTRFPMPIRGIDTDNDSAFINDTLLAYCGEKKIEFTRSRAYQKNDQAWIEQKNGSVIRRFVGYERHAGLVAGQCLGRLYQSLRLYVNYFQPSFKLRSKTRVGAKVKKLYHKPATPCERLLAHASVSTLAKESLRAELAPLDPLKLLHQIREGQSALVALGSGDLQPVSDRQSLEDFLAKLPEIWRDGEVRPTHREKASPPRDWRTREDPFAKVWPEILLWLQSDPESTAKVMMDRLQQSYPGQFPDAQLRTLQRRVREWRRVMARSLVHGGTASASERLFVGAEEKSKVCGPAE
jgi:hypothetical protein